MLRKVANLVAELPKKPSASLRSISFFVEQKPIFTVVGKSHVQMNAIVNEEYHKKMVNLFMNNREIYDEIATAIKEPGSKLSEEAKIFVDNVPLMHPHGLRDAYLTKQFMSVRDIFEGTSFAKHSITKAGI